MLIPSNEFHVLVDALVPFAQHMLQNHDNFLPIGAVVKSGEVVIQPPFAQPPASAQAWLEGVKEALRKESAESTCTAVAYCVDAKLTDTRNDEVTSAVHVAFEHRSGEALQAFFPYRKDDDGYEFAQPMLRIAAPCFFTETPVSRVN